MATPCKARSPASLVDRGNEGVTESYLSVSNAAMNRGDASIQSKARGIPNGYLNKLETRLAETEAALFRALSGVLDSPGSGSASSPVLLPQAAWTPRQNKVDRVKEWELLPLQTPNEIEAWFRSKAAEQSDPVPEPPDASPQSPVSSVSDSVLAPHPVRDSDSMPAQRPLLDAVIEPRLRSMTPIATTPVNEVPSDSVSKAKELSKSQRNLYF
ncbi:uncharacterized protein GLRG_01835 [Colletotrichum graminicola M1.001]|uniref:Uncharacterized protein n=1 Tax=Colletotrichum graminicola (strain M1.001 / M2 / FGSC 10212) TaxID=645133 RepID=E3Q9G1_COLGM|nr:uncharacterized protein GLRG_01835 [Colletotrichum graminicola M1.001]EFQ27340.1 hypothetical protein GLRG_01835 [Colletotrichum graminicola M1.001]